jgi:acetyl esterase/lipase
MQQSCPSGALGIMLLLTVLPLPRAAAARDALPHSLAASKVAPRFSPSVMLRNSGVGEVRFSPNGDRLFVEELQPYDTFPTVGERSSVLVARLDGKENEVRLEPLPNAPRAGLQIGPVSPHGSKMAVAWWDESAPKVGIYEFSTQQLLRFDLRVDACWPWGIGCLKWRSDDEFVYVTPSTSAHDSELKKWARYAQLASRLTALGWRDPKPASMVWNSGIRRTEPIPLGDQLVRVNTTTGAISTIAQGKHIDFSLSPNGRWILAFRESNEVGSFEAPMESVNWEETIVDVVLYDLEGPERTLCTLCLASSGSIRWADQSDAVSFELARAYGGSNAVSRNGHSQFLIYRIGQERPEPVDRATDPIRGIVWLGDSPIMVPVSTISHASEERESQHKGVRLHGGSDLPESLDNYVGRYRDSLLLTSGSALWKVSAETPPKELSKYVPRGFVLWCQPLAYIFWWPNNAPSCRCQGLKNSMSAGGAQTYSAEDGGLRDGWLTFVQSEGTRRDILFLNVETDDRVLVRGPRGDATLVSASAAARAAVFALKDSSADHLVLFSSVNPPRELLRFNAHLAGIPEPAPVMLPRGPNEADWILMPPGQKQGQRYPLLVYFYPGTTYDRSWRGSDLRTIDFLNMNIPASMGYAVLFVSMSKPPAADAEGGRTLWLSQQLNLAAARAVQAGFADARRWVVIGHSYAAYLAMAAITRSNDFAAAVALEGISDLGSGYSAIGESLLPAFYQMMGYKRPSSVRWLEKTYQGVDGAPWQAPLKYLNNSPLYFADRISTPLLLVHSQDDAVAASQSEQMFNALEIQGKPVRFVRYWGESHSFRRPANISNLWAEILAWTDRYLDISRDEDGELVWDQDSVRSRGGTPARTPEWFSDLDARRLSTAATGDRTNH